MNCVFYLETETIVCFSDVKMQQISAAIFIIRLTGRLFRRMIKNSRFGKERNPGRKGFKQNSDTLTGLLLLNYRRIKQLKF